ncbi:MAG: xanthine dehydrogenase family protein subunit M [Chloroflexota bacterium]
MNRFEYARASSPEEATALLADETSRIIAGGTDLLPLMKESIISPARLVDISPWLEGRAIVQNTEQLEIGALVTLSEIARNEEIRTQYTALADACGLAAAPQLRNMGTIGGNLLQATRCAYFRGPYDCWLKGGDICFAREGENEQHSIFLTSPAQSMCVSAHPSDPATALLALGARVRYQTASAEVEVDLSDFYRLPTEGQRSITSMPRDAVITGVVLPAKPTKSLYRKAMARATWSFALAGIGMSIKLEQGAIAEARVALGGVAPIPVRANEVEQAMLGHKPGELAVGDLAHLLVRDARPLSQNGYKVQLLMGLFKQLLRDLVA